MYYVLWFACTSVVQKMEPPTPPNSPRYGAAPLPTIAELQQEIRELRITNGIYRQYNIELQHHLRSLRQSYEGMIAMVESYRDGFERSINIVAEIRADIADVISELREHGIEVPIRQTPTPWTDDEAETSVGDDGEDEPESPGTPLMNGWATELYGYEASSEEEDDDA